MNPVSLDELMEVDVNIPVEMVQGEQVDDMQDLSESEDELDAITGDLLKKQPLREGFKKKEVIFITLGSDPP